MKNILYAFVILFCNSTFAANKYDLIIKKMKKLAKNNPTIAKVFTLGVNDRGDNILALEVGFSSFKQTDLVVGVHHGNEVETADLAMEFATNLIKDPVSERRFIIVPVLNISGYNSNTREELDLNNKWWDPNRDYPDPCIKKKNFNLKSTKALADYVLQNDIISAVTIHGYYGSFTYPWGIFSDDYQSLDQISFHSLAKKSVSPNNYRIGTHADILYPAGGAFEDWAYFSKGIWSMLIEVEDNPNLQNDKEMLLAFFKNSPTRRSMDFRHTGTCTQTRGPFKSRP